MEVHLHLNLNLKIKEKGPVSNDRPFFDGQHLMPTIILIF